MRGNGCRELERGSVKFHAAPNPSSGSGVRSYAADFSVIQRQCRWGEGEASAALGVVSEILSPWKRREPHSPSPYPKVEMQNAECRMQNENRRLNGSHSPSPYPLPGGEGELSAAL